MHSVTDFHSPLVERICSLISSKGPIHFARYMQEALYAPGLGYYSSGLQKFGKDGDFVTAPEISPLFAICLATQIAQIFETLPNADIFEFGAGSGILAADMLLELERLDQLPKHYFILELSADLQQRQRSLLKERIPHLVHKVIWLSDLTEFKFQGVLIANEVLDAMPVRKFKWYSHGLQEFYVDWQENQFVWELSKPSFELESYLKQLTISLTDNYESEANLLLEGWIKTINDILIQGIALLIDYGFLREEYYHPQRCTGTLMCHYQHRAHDNPLILTGLQDITAHVDFTAVGEFASANQMQVAGYTTQANFLLNCGITEKINANASAEQQWETSQQIKKLLMPNEMGELFKIMALTKNLTSPLMGFKRMK